MSCASFLGRVLIISGSDSGGGAGLQADLKTVTALGGYGATAVTALTVQDTQGVYGVMNVPVGFIRHQMEVVLSDIGVDCFKSGMLSDASIMEEIANVIDSTFSTDYRPPYVLDPVMVAKGGAVLLEAGEVSALKSILLPMASLVTPNIPEAEALTGLEVETLDDQKRTAEIILTMGAGATLVKGGHLGDDEVCDVLATQEDMDVFTSPRLNTRHTHGTGCTLASGVAALLAQGWTLIDAVIHARHYVYEAIRLAPGLGSGHGPLHHGHTVIPPVVK